MEHRKNLSVTIHIHRDSPHELYHFLFHSNRRKWYNLLTIRLITQTNKQGNNCSVFFYAYHIFFTCSVGLRRGQRNYYCYDCFIIIFATFLYLFVVLWIAWIARTSNLINRMKFELVGKLEYRGLSAFRRLLLPLKACNIVTGQVGDLRSLFLCVCRTLS